MAAEPERWQADLLVIEDAAKCLFLLRFLWKVSMPLHCWQSFSNAFLCTTAKMCKSGSVEIMNFFSFSARIVQWTVRQFDPRLFTEQSQHGYLPLTRAPHWTLLVSFWTNSICCEPTGSVHIHNECNHRDNNVTHSFFATDWESILKTAMTSVVMHPLDSRV